MANYTKSVAVHRFSYTPDTTLFTFLYIQQIMKRVRTPTQQENETYERPQTALKPS